MAFFSGTKAQNGTYFQPEQQLTYQQQQGAAQGKPMGGAYGQAYDYYSGNLSNNPQDFDAFAAPELRRYNEQTIPDLAEQFAGMGAGGLQSSGFRNAAVSAGTDLNERLGAIRANLRSQSAQGLMNIGQQSLQDYSTYSPAQPGFLDYAAQAAPAIIGGVLGGPAGAAVGAGIGGAFGAASSKGQSSPYGKPKPGVQTNRPQAGIL